MTLNITAVIQMSANYQETAIKHCKDNQTYRKNNYLANYFIIIRFMKQEVQALTAPEPHAIVLFDQLNDHLAPKSLSIRAVTSAMLTPSSPLTSAQIVQASLPAPNR